MNDDLIRVSIVLGAFWGDEGKGKTVSWLCEEDPENSIVVRFNGGHQAGHTVNYNGTEHTFSSFGSGTLQNIPTIISSHCTVYPIALMNEYDALMDNNRKWVTPRLHISKLCPITTPYDYLANRVNTDTLNHGTCGVGFGETMRRHESMYKLYYMDLFNDFILREKMLNIKSYYESIYPDFNNLYDGNNNIINLLEHFYTAIDLIKTYDIGRYEYDIQEGTHLIFEGAQGILLDKDFGLFPHVTYSNTTAKNAQDILRSTSGNFSSICIPDIYYVSRTYQTRHGNGPMSKFKEDMLPFENEHNVSNEYQGNFKLGEFDGELLDYSIKCNETHFKMKHTKNLVLTCGDQHPIPANYLQKCLRDGNFSKYFLSSGPYTDNMEQLFEK